MAEKRGQYQYNDDGSVSSLVAGDIAIEESKAIVPVDIQARLASTIQTHNAVSVGVTSWSNGAWIDCNGFDKIAYTVKNDAPTSSQVGIHWSHDGSTQVGDETLSAVSTTYQQGIIDIKARYCRLNVKNGAVDIAHTMSAWAFLKA